MSSDTRIVISGRVKPDTAVAWLARGKAVGSATSSNASMFTAIAAVLGQLANDTAALDTAEAAAKDRGKSDVQARNAKWALLRKSYRATVLGVQGLCDGAVDQEHAQAIAAAASFTWTTRAGRTKPDFAGKALGNGAVRITVKVPVKKGARCFYEWRLSTDGGKSWTILASTNVCTTLVSGLTPMTEVQFSFRYTAKNVVSAWSAGIPVVVK
jgi:hypothetical protein